MVYTTTYNCGGITFWVWWVWFEHIRCWFSRGRVNFRVNEDMAKLWKTKGKWNKHCGSVQIGYGQFGTRLTFVVFAYLIWSFQWCRGVISQEAYTVQGGFHHPEYHNPSKMRRSSPCTLRVSSFSLVIPPWGPNAAWLVHWQVGVNINLASIN